METSETLKIESKILHSPSYENSQWFERFLKKLKLLTKAEKSIHDDDWEVPFERIRICRNEFQGGGSQGDVFYGRLSNIAVAVKRVKDVSLTNIRHLRELNHKNIIKFRGISSNSSTFYILMEWCPYGTLHYHIHCGRQLSAAILTNFTLQIASGMRYLHSKNIIHRDLKPSNILLTHHDVLKISDFGTHKVFDGKTSVNSTYAGTHAYMAPEVIRSEPYSFPLDVWSYGVVVWEILTGDEPHKNLGPGVLLAVGRNSFKLPIPSTFPDSYALILEGCWKDQPKERHNFQQICMILKSAIHSVDKIPKERWLPLQAEWKREIKEKLNQQLYSKNDVPEDPLTRQRRQALKEALDQAEKIRNINNSMYLKLQETSLHLERDRDEMLRQKAEIAETSLHLQREKEEILRQKAEIAERSLKLQGESEEFLRQKTELDKLRGEVARLEELVAKREQTLTQTDENSTNTTL